MATKRKRITREEYIKFTRAQGPYFGLSHRERMQIRRDLKRKRYRRRRYRDARKKLGL